MNFGYYFVTSSTGALCNLTTTAPIAEINDKNDVPFIKTADKTTADIGEIVQYELTGKVPDTTGFNTFTYLITDNMSAGLTFRDDVVLTISGAAVDAAKYEIKKVGNGFELRIFVMQLKDKAGQEIKVKYSAVINEAAVAVISRNTAVLKYSNDPTNENSTTEITVVKKVYSAKIVINKYETGSEAKKLAGAKFVLKNSEDKYYKYVPAQGDEAARADWIDTKEGATEVTTDSNGAATFEGLKDGTYKLEETCAPAGYNLLTDDVTVEINGAAATDTNLTTLTATADIANSKGTMLPATGGIGTTLFYVFGSIMVLGAAIFVVVKKRMSLTK